MTEKYIAISLSTKGKRECVIINFLDADDADDADFSGLLYPIGYNLSALSAKFP